MACLLGRGLLGRRRPEDANTTEAPCCDRERQVLQRGASPAQVKRPSYGKRVSQKTHKPVNQAVEVEGPGRDSPRCGAVNLRAVLQSRTQTPARLPSLKSCTVVPVAGEDHGFPSAGVRGLWSRYEHQPRGTFHSTAAPRGTFGAPLGPHKNRRCHCEHQWREPAGCTLARAIKSHNPRSSAICNSIRLCNNVGACRGKASNS